MKKFCIILGIILMSLLFAGNVDGRTFTQDEVLAIYQGAAKRLGEEGQLSKFVNTTLHDEFIWSWDVHYLNYSKIGCNLVLRVSEKNISGGYTSILYYFHDYDFDGKVDRASRLLLITYTDDGSIIVPNYPPEIRDAINAYQNHVPNAQEMYEAELEYWYNELREEIEGDDKEGS